VAIPTLFLYEISIWVSKYLYKQAPAEPEVELSGMD
jgi:Sec-independent protein secretion pathway component TatC